jgi:hypothetical protein
VLPVTGETDLLAEIRVSVEAERAGLTGHGRIDSHSPAVFSHSRELVAQDQRPGDRCLADRTLAEPVEIRAAEPHRADPHEGFARLRCRPLLVMEPEVSLPVEPEGAH